MNEELELEEHFLGFYALTRFDTDHVCLCILDMLQQFNLSVKNLRGQCYDGVTVMAGCVNGVASRILEKTRDFYTLQDKFIKLSSPGIRL